MQASRVKQSAIGKYWAKSYSKSGWLGTDFKLHEIGDGEILNMKILDVGCGNSFSKSQTGHSLIEFSGTYVGLDICRSAVKAAKRRFPEASFVTGDARSLPFPDNSFDTVVSIALLSWLGRDISLAVHEMARVSRQNVMVTIENKKPSEDFPIAEETPYGKLLWLSGYPQEAIFCNEKEISTVFEENGLVPEIQDIGGVFYVKGLKR